MRGVGQHFSKMRGTIIENPYIPHDPTVKQAEFLLTPKLEAFYGGAAGGGKSDALLMGALQYVDYPGYAALLLRRTYTDLALPGAIMDRAFSWLYGSPAKWHDKSKTWLFPSGATVTFGYLESENDKHRYQGSEFQFIGFDEASQFTETQYLYLFSRLRKNNSLVGVPLRMRAASNPGGVGHEWVRGRFLIAKAKDRVFIPARLEDNPYIGQKEYDAALAHLDPVTRKQLREGDWEIRAAGNKFKSHWFKIVDSYPADGAIARFWDLAATEPKVGADPDYTAGCKIAEKDGQYWIIDIKRDRLTPKGVEQLIYQTAILDGKACNIWMEQEPGSSGVNVIDHYRREVLKGFTFRGVKTTGKKEVRANPLSAAAEAGNVFIVRGAWNSAFLDELEAFPTEGIHDDQVDAASGAFTVLNNTPDAGLLRYYEQQERLAAIAAVAQQQANYF